MNILEGGARMDKRARIIKVWARDTLILGIILCSVIFLWGCGTLETLVDKNGTSTSFGNFIGGDKTALPAASMETTSAEQMAVTLYFADSSGKYLVKEQRMLPKTVSAARETVTEWLKGPVNEASTAGTSLQALVPSKTKLLDISIKNNVATVDLSKEFLQPNSKVSPEVALYGLVNTLTQFPSVKQVQIRIEGKPLTKYGSIDATELVAKASLVKGSGVSNPILPSQASKNSGANAAKSDSSGEALPNSPSSINLFNYPPSST